VLAFIALTLLPMTVLFFFSINFISTSIEFWFNVPVEQALENSIRVGRDFYHFAEESNRFYAERIAYQLDKKAYLSDEKQKALGRYIQISQREFNLDAVEVYDTNFSRIHVSVSDDLATEPLKVVAAGIFQRGLASGPLWTVSETVSQGELVRTLASVPFEANAEQPVAYVVVSTLFPPDLIGNMQTISRGFEEYQQIKLLKKPIQIVYLMTLSIVALLVVFCASWFGFYLAKSITIPIMELAEGARRVAEGDLGVNIEMVGDDEIGSLVSAFNTMTRDLRNGREKLELSTRILRDQNIEIEEKRQYMEIVLKNVSAGVITLDADGVTTTINTSAEKMLNLKAAQVLDRNYTQLLTGKLLGLAEEMMTKLTATNVDTVELPLKLSVDGRPRSFLINVTKLKDDAGQHMGLVMVFDDLTELEKAQRMAAWREVARRIAHEVKNPLTPITLSAQRLKRKYGAILNDAIFEECTRMIIDHVDLIRNLVNEFSSFARFPAADPKPCHLPPIIEETVALYREGHNEVSFAVRIPDDIPQLSLDRQQIKQAMINLVDNAVAAVKNSGRVDINLTHDSILKMVRIEVADNGSGITDEDKTRLFEPNFSTKKSGMGLGLTIVSSIVSDHNGLISVRDNTPRGAKFVIELPV
jgi:two-component system nitrogen regulation sensor histidine kinase NtrY